MGNATTDGTSRYADINSDSEHIYIISGDLYTAMQTPVYEMCRLPELPTLAEAQMLSITLQGPKTEQADTETDGRRTTGPDSGSRGGRCGERFLAGRRGQHHG